MKISVIVILAALLYYPIQAQDNSVFVFDNNPASLDYSDIDQSKMKDHPFGTEVSAKLVLLNDRYTYIEKATPTSPTDKTIVIKPTIYNSIMKLNRSYKKDYNKGILGLDEARDSFLKYLDLGLILYSEDTDAFEAVLSKAKKPGEIADVYDRIELR